MDRREFINAVQRRLGPTFAAPAEDCMRAVFQVLHARLDPGQARHIESHLPKEFKDDWQLSRGTDLSRKAGREFKSLDREEFLTEVQQKAGLGSTGEAVHWEPRPEPAGHEYEQRWLGSPQSPPPQPPEAPEEQSF